MVAKKEDAVVEKQVTGSAESQPKETTFKADEFDKVISKSKKKKVVTLKVEKALIPDRFLNLNDEEKPTLLFPYFAVGKMIIGRENNFGNIIFKVYPSNFIDRINMLEVYLR